MHFLSLTTHILYAALHCMIYYGTNSLQTLRIVAPEYVIYGDPLWLNCSSDLQYNQIYSIKWFKDNQEFYRFITTDPNPTTFYETNGIHPDQNKSEYGNVYLAKTDFYTEATFRCEISAEEHFETLHKQIRIKVYVIPSDPNPVISGLKKSQYRPNELVNLTCTSPQTSPAAKLTVSLNGNSITTSSNYHQRVFYNNYENNMSATSINIQFPRDRLYKRTNVFECTSAIIHKFNKNSQVNLVTKHKSEQHSNSEDIFLTEGDNERPDDKLAPLIKGLKTSYIAGDFVNITCVSARYKPVPELMWFINSQEVDVKFLNYHQPTYYGGDYAEASLGLQFTIQLPTGNYSKNPSKLNLKCVETLTEVISVGKESVTIPSTSEPISNNSVGAVKSFMDSTGCNLYITSSKLLSFLSIIAATIVYYLHH